MHPNYTFSDQMILEDDLVLLRPLSLSDVENLLDISENEPETWEYSLVRADGKTNLENYLQLALEAKSKGTEFPFIIFIKGIRIIKYKIIRIMVLLLPKK